jgi:hypothetical protein
MIQDLIHLVYLVTLHSSFRIRIYVSRTPITSIVESVPNSRNDLWLHPQMGKSHASTQQPPTRLENPERRAKETFRVSGESYPC